MSWRDAPLVKPAGTPAWQSAPLANKESQSGVFTITPGGMIDQATWDRLQREKPQVAANLLEEHSADAVARDVSIPRAAWNTLGKWGAKRAAGIQQLAGTLDENEARNIQSDLEAFKPLERHRPYTTGATELVADIVATAPIPMGAAGLTLRGFGSAAGANAGLAAIDFVPEGQSRLGNAGEAAAFGAAGHGVMAVAGKSINALRGQMRNAREQAIWNTARANNIPLTQGDVTQNPILQSIDGTLERVAFIGNMGLRNRQATRATQMLERMREDYLHHVGGGAPDQLRDALWRRMNQGRDQARRLYDQVQTLAGDAPVLTTNLAQTARQLIQREQQNIPAEGMQSQGLLALLEPYTVDAGLTYEGARQLRSRLRRDIRTAHRNAVIGTEEVVAANRLVDGLEADLAEFGRQRGGALNVRLQQADRHYRQNVVPYKDRLLATTMNDENMDLHLEKWIANPDRARMAYRAADARGRDALRYALLDRAMTNSRVGPPGQEYISPDLFTKQIRNMRQSVGEVFVGESRRQLDGATNLMHYLRSIDRSHRVEATGAGAQKNNIMLAGSIGTATGLATGAVAPSSALLGAGFLTTIRMALSSNAGARLMSAAADMRNPGSLGYIWDSLRRIAERNASVLDGSQPPSETSSVTFI